jgi:hypothetical protein
MKSTWWTNGGRRTFVGGSEAHRAPDHTNAHKRLFAVFHRRRLPERLPKAHSGPSAVLVDELNSSTSQYPLDCGQRCCIACVPADLNISDGVAMEAGCFREIPHGPIQRCSGHSYLCTCHSSRPVLLSHVPSPQ